MELRSPEQLPDGRDTDRSEEFSRKYLDIYYANVWKRR